MKLTTKQDKWLSLAVADEPTRYDINAIYRDKNHFVATNGHVLHTIKMPNEVKPHFPCGLKGNFPDWQQFIGKDKKIYYNYSPQIISELKKAIQILSRFLSNTGTEIKHQTVGLTFYRHGINCKVIGFYKDEGNILIGNYFDSDDQASNISVSNKYLLNALYDSSDNFNTTFSYTDDLSPLLISSKLDGLETTALIMPMRTN